jgi:arsenate reductase
MKRSETVFLFDVDNTLLDADGDTILDAMAKEPILIERPLVRTDKGVRLCRPQDLVRDIL